jgi:hypothetical protein
MQDDFAREDDDQTIRIVRPSSVPKLRGLLAALTPAALLAAGLAAWIVVRPPSPSTSALEPAAASLDVPLADEATILAARAPDMLVFRFRDAPSVLVLSFPSLRQQGEMLDRVAAFVEKAGLPRGRVLADLELDSAIRQVGDTRETYYFGHDYRVADIARFFAMVDRDGTVLDAEETRLRALFYQAGMLTTGAVGALISIPPEVDAHQIDAAARASFLRHELSHGIFFTDPAYAAYAQTFW